MSPPVQSLALMCFVHSTACRYACQQFYQTVCVLGAGVITAALVRMSMLLCLCLSLSANSPESYIPMLVLESTNDWQTNAACGKPLNRGDSSDVAAHKRTTTLCTTKWCRHRLAHSLNETHVFLCTVLWRYWPVLCFIPTALSASVAFICYVHSL